MISFLQFPLFHLVHLILKFLLPPFQISYLFINLLPFHPLIFLIDERNSLHIYRIIIAILCTLIFHILYLQIFHTPKYHHFIFLITIISPKFIFHNLIMKLRNPMSFVRLWMLNLKLWKQTSGLQMSLYSEM